MPGLSSVATVMTDVFQINQFSVWNKIDKIAKLYDKILIKVTVRGGFQ